MVGFDPELRMKVRMDTLRVSGDPAAICHGTCCGTELCAAARDYVLRRGMCCGTGHVLRHEGLKPNRWTQAEMKLEARRDARGIQAEMSVRSE